MKTLTTGEIAKLCDVHLRTVIRWIEKGRLKAFKLPGRGNNRVKEEDFVTFLKDNDMPVPEQFREQGPQKILIVDDEPAMVKALQRLFKLEGYATDVAHDGFQAGVGLSSFRPDLMTLDLSMPGIDGYEVLEYVRSHSELSDTKIIVISALNDVALDGALALGANAAIPKPYDSEQLVALVATLLEEGDSAS